MEDKPAAEEKNGADCGASSSTEKELPASLTADAADKLPTTANNEEGDEQPTLSFNDLRAMVDEEDDLMTAVFAGSDERNCSYPQGYVKRQALFACRDCSNKGNKAATTSSSSATDEKALFPEPAGVCLACALACHADHDLVELYTKRNFRCDCGNSKLTEVPCRLLPNKEADNPLNAYNHNFSGLYCTCEKPYPVDPDDPEAEKIADEEMVQCIVCEDWFHACHLDIPPEDVPLLEKEDEEYELICPACSAKHQFLVDYYLESKKKQLVEGSNEDAKNGAERSEVCLLKKINEDKRSNEQLPGDSPATSTSEPAIIEQASSSASSSGKVLLLPPNWRASLCKCANCIEMYSQQNIAFITDLSDTLAAYEAAGRARTADSTGGTMSDRLVTATLANIRDRVVQTEIAHGYAELKAKLTEFMAEVGTRKRVVTEEDVNEFFERLSDKKRKRFDDHQCGSSGSNGKTTDGDDEGSSGIGTPPATCHGNW